MLANSRIGMISVVPGPAEGTGETRQVTENNAAEIASVKAVRKHVDRLLMEGKSERTAEVRGQTLARLRKTAGVPLLEVTAEQLYDWRAGLAHLSDTTVANYISNVACFYRWCVKEKLIGENPAEDIPVPKLPSRQPHPISEAELWHAISYAQYPVRLWLMLAAGCGLRQKEIRLLRVDAIRLRDANPHIEVRYDATKGKTERTVPVPPWLVSELEAADLPVTGLAFRKVDGKPLGREWVSKQCNQHLHGMGITNPFHSLRHRYLSQAYAVDHDIRVVQALAGHKHLQTTAGYAAIDSKSFARTVNAIPSPLGPAVREAS